MKKSMSGAVIFTLFVLLSGFIFYTLTTRTSNSFKSKEFENTVTLLEERIDSLEKYRGLIAESTSSIEQELDTLKRRSSQLDIEIGNLRDVAGSARSSVKSPHFRWRNFHLTTGSSLLIVAFLILIWLLFTAVSRESVKECDINPPAEDPVHEDESAGEPPPGNVNEEEYPFPPAEKNSGDEDGADPPPEPETAEAEHESDDVMPDAEDQPHPPGEADADADADADEEEEEEEEKASEETPGSKPAP